MKYHYQLDETDCGPACLVMIASHYKSYISIGKARELCRTDRVGTTIGSLAQVAQKIGFDASPMHGEIADTTFNNKFIFPFIAHIRIPYMPDSLLDHYVVVANITSKKIKIWDPDLLKGKYTIGRREFLKIWTGYVLFLSPSIEFKPEKESARNIFKFLPLLAPHKSTLIIVCLSSALLIVFGIITSYYFKYIIDEVVISKAAFTLTAFSIGILAVTLLQTIVEGVRSVLINYIAFQSELSLNLSYVSHILKLSLYFFDSRKTGEILSRLTDINKIREMLTGTALSLVLDFVLIIIIGPILFKISGILFALSTANIIVMSMIIFCFSKIFRKNYGKLRMEEAEVNSTLVEAIGGIYTIKALNAEERITNLYEEKRMRALWTNWKTSRITIWQRLLAALINNLTNIAVFWIGSSGIIKDTFSFGTLLSFNALLSYFTGPLFRMINIHPLIQEAGVAAERVCEILEMDVEQTDNLHLLKPSKFEGNISFSHVSFRYGVRQFVYQDLSFSIKKGEWVAFVGPSGCGKTTLIKLLLKFYNPDNGNVFIDSYNLRDIDAAVLRSHIGYVPQDIYLFAGTIAENIMLHKVDATMNEITKAAEKAGADEFINRLPERYNTKISEHGTTLSGGERQRLALARAFLRKPDILVLDEATSNLDTVSERGIHSTIEKNRGNMTVIIVAHRLATVRNCDIIFVMDKGAIIECGNHNELISKKGLYSSMWDGNNL
jgi:ATP-binding cassette subfamily B protein